MLKDLVFLNEELIDAAKEQTSVIFRRLTVKESCSSKESSSGRISQSTGAGGRSLLDTCLACTNLMTVRRNRSFNQTFPFQFLNIVKHMYRKDIPKGL